MDAATDEATGEEAVGGSAATPDQDIVENLGRAAGVTYEDVEELNPVEKVKKRDRKRWELNPSVRSKGSGSAMAVFLEVVRSATRYNCTIRATDED